MKNQKVEDFERTDFLFGANSVFIEELYQQFLKDPNSVDPSWLELFNQQKEGVSLKSTSKIIIKDLPKNDVSQGQRTGGNLALENALRAKFMINDYRDHGHYLAYLDPLNLEVRKTHEELRLNIENFGFTEQNLNEIVDVSNVINGLAPSSLRDIKNLLENTYTKSIAAEFTHIENIEERNWLYSQMENASSNHNLSADDKKRYLKDLVEVDGFEQYIHTKFPGAKRFSIEGGDASIICLDVVIEQSCNHEVKEMVLGMAHRGRLSTLTKIMQKPYRAVLAEFKGISAFPKDLNISGDVKYHMGYSSEKTFSNNKTIHLSLTPNPSHLEAVNPVVAGKTRAKQDLLNRDRSSVVGILVHGDAAFCGQGVVAESLVMSGLKPYEVGGIFHLVINNQVGFTADAKDGRPGRYCTEVAKMVGAPILHVNGDDIEAVILATKIACDYRMKFCKDVVVDIVCYRKYGHNEGDEPMYTQSVMYNVIKTKQTPAEIYAKKLVEQSVIDSGYLEQLQTEFKNTLDKEFAEIENYVPPLQWLDGMWKGFERNNSKVVNTGVAKSKLQKMTRDLCAIPKSFALNSKLKKLFSTRVETIDKDQPIDWATAEQLAFATILEEKIPIRITGQDSGRGTFSHRHAVLHSQNDESIYVPLNNVSKEQAFFEVADSNLSEYGVLGFEYGYSLVNPNHLVIWEAQFGDFCNGAQIIFDQFISSAETKWMRMSGLVCLLPNAMEGQGPEHSSARIERFLQLCAENNMQVVYPTTPASIFHLLRRQVKSNTRKPLIVMSPKSLLRHKLAVSPLSDLDENTSFSPIIDEIDSDIDARVVKKVIFCSGKVYYDLLEKRRGASIKDTAIIRLEQLYPFANDIVSEIVNKYSKATEFVWCQEEARNMGAWKFIRSYMDEILQKTVRKNIVYIGRDEASSPAVGYLSVHNKQQEALVSAALGIKN
ncbi:MAG: 2-oxoglutarate dehydrogenase E1 component [Rickettsiales bacterium]|nr:MAG: 2-oxoglutarate dehydrogenase E1 component [Rickettsiales bacterium]